MSGGELRFGVLGPLLVAGPDGPLRLPRSPVLRGLLGVLLVAEGRPLGHQRLAELVWAERRDPVGRGSVHVGISRLRDWLDTLPATVSVEHGPAGYRLERGQATLDLATFRAGLAAAEGDPDRRLHALLAALALVRGPVLDDLAGLDPADPLLRPVAEAVRDATLALAQAAMAAGQPAAAVGQLEALVVASPLDEPAHAALIALLGAAGRPADALARYEALRARLADSFGTSPSQAVQAAHLGVLALDRELAPADLTPAPCLLPPDVADFSGRGPDVAALLACLRGDHGGHALVVSALAGMAGVGKTALAVHVAHLARADFPDGQLYVNLHGAEAHPAEPGGVLGRFLRALGVDAAMVPERLDEQAELYRDRLADRRVLVVLDNAADEAQVLPLLPGSPSCGVLVTSRARLTGLPGAELVQLGVLEPAQALELLGRVLGPGRIEAEPEAAAELARLCGHLPLALRIVGARLAGRPHWTLAAMAGRLRDEHRRLDELAHAHLAVRASFALSSEGLDAATRRLFRLLGLLEAAECAAWVAAALLDSGMDEAEERLEELVDAHLLEVAGRDQAGLVRYRFHDLVRVHARERAEAAEPPEARAAAMTRAFGAWLALAERAYEVAHGGSYYNLHGTAARWLPPDRRLVAGLVREPCQWLESERAALVAAVRQSAAAGLDELCWDLAVTAASVCPNRGSYPDWQRTHQLALEATRASGNRRGEAAVTADIGSLYGYHDRYDEALKWLEGALPLLDDVGERHGHALALSELAIIERLRGRLDAALARFELARTGLHEVGDLLGEAYVLRNIGQVELDLGRPAAAVARFEQALEGARAAGSPLVESQVLYWLGEACMATGQPEAARRAYAGDLAIIERLGDPHGKALAQLGLGRVALAGGAHDEAAARFATALDLATESDEPFVVAQVRFHLGELDLATGQAEAAAGRLGDALRLFRELDSPQWAVRALLGLAAAAAASGDHDGATAARHEASALAAEVGLPVP